MRLALADALDFRRMQGINLRPTLFVVLRQDTVRQRQQLDKSLLHRFVISNLAGDVANDTPEIGLEFLQAFIRPFELVGMGVTLMFDQRELADTRIGLV